MCLVSVIVPIYEGKKYLENIIYMVEKNAKYANVATELIFINDYPEENIAIYKSASIKIIYFSNDCNKGIHYSRVKGLKYASGEYVLFLDQDDDIDDLYIKSQLEHIGNADAVICNGMNNRKAIYDSMEIQKCVSNLETMINGNKIVSPGQVLIKRDSIPSEWMENILVNNYSDDYFLWLLMLGQGKKIVINSNILYKHIYTGENTSLNRDKRCKSVNELLDYMEKWDYLSEKQIAQIRKRSFELSGKYYSYTKIFDMWMQILEEGNSLENILLSRGYKKIVVYGAGILGRHLVRQLKESSVEVGCIIDRNSYTVCDNVTVIMIGDKIYQVDAIIVTPVNEFEEIEAELKQFYKTDIISLDKLLRDGLYSI